MKTSCADQAFFCNSGAEANEAAIKLARKYAHCKLGIENPIILSAKASFHGRTIAALSATGQPKYQKGFEPLLEGFKFFSFNNSESFQKLYNQLEQKGPRISAVLIEPIQGEGGIHPGEKLFFKLIKEVCAQNKILLIFDEVQTGIGRTGKLWGYQNLDVEPDAFTIAKGLGGGHPIGALLVKKHVDVFEVGDHASTFGGNPFACRAGITVLEEIKKRNLLKNTKCRGEQLKEGLLKLAEKFHNDMSGVRGMGLIQGFVIKEESKITSQVIIEEAIKQGLLLISAGPKVIRIVPPLVITKKEIDLLLEKLDIVLSKLI